jgi:hypothetical protein
MPASPSQTKTTRGKNGKSNGASAVTAETPAVTASASPGVSSMAVSDQEIARRAYEIYEREGRQPGTELANWLKAEAELSSTKRH